MAEFRQRAIDFVLEDAGDLNLKESEVRKCEMNDSKLLKSGHIQVEITQHRLRLLGHILRSDLNTPANQMMIQYFTNPRNMEKYKGRQPITPPSILQRDLQLANHNLRTINDCIRLRDSK